MAKEILHNESKIISASAKEIADLIGLLAAQLAEAPLIGNQSGAVPSMNISENGSVKYKLLIVLDNESRNKDK